MATLATATFSPVIALAPPPPGDVTATATVVASAAPSSVMWVRRDGSWVPARMYHRVAGVWKAT